MRSEVIVSFPNTAPVRIDLDEVQPLPHDQARIWLDAQFTQMDCEPLRPTGKLLTADKVLVVAQAAAGSGSPILPGRWPSREPPARRWPNRCCTSMWRRWLSATDISSLLRLQPPPVGREKLSKREHQARRSTSSSLP